MSDEPVEDKILKDKILREMGFSPWQLKDLFDRFDKLHKEVMEMRSSLDNMNHIMNLRTNSLRNDLDDLKATVDSLDEIIDRNY
jgi:hypothetical protein